MYLVKVNDSNLNQSARLTRTS